MARKIPRDSSLAEWSANPHVAAGPDFSLIREGVLNTGLFLPVAKNRKVCLAAHGLFAEWKYANAFGSSEFIDGLSRPRTKIEDSIILTCPENHWHYNIDGLANLGEEVLSRSNTIYVDQNLSDDQVLFLQLYAKMLGNENISANKLVHSNYYLRNTYIPTNKPFATKVANFRACLARIDGLPPHPDAGKRLYVSRKGAGTRQLLNEGALLSMLEATFDFRPILNENYSIIDQIRLYKHADIVMGPHGAGLTNIIFSENPSLFVELFNGVQQPFYPALSQALGVRYLGVRGPGAAPARDAHRADNEAFHVDVAGIRDALHKLLNTPA
jgi:Glycosyltransferase 61